MDVEAITLALLDQTLDAWERDEPVPAVWQSFVAWPQLRGLLPTALNNELQKLWGEMVWQQLQQQRQVEGLPVMTPPTTRTAVIAAMVQEFSQNNNKELEGWSALYYRHFSPICLKVNQIVTAVPTSGRDFSRTHLLGRKKLLKLLQQQELAAHGRAQTARLCRHLPPPDYTHLFGVEPLLNRLLAWAAAPDGPSFFSVEGIGGIGKTTVARAAAHQIAALGQWADVLWVSARQHDLDVEHGRIQPTARVAQTFEDIALHLSEQLGQIHLAGLPAAVKLERLQPGFKAHPHLLDFRQSKIKGGL